MIRRLFRRFGLLALAIATVVFFTGCNRYLNELEARRDQNVVALVEAQHQALEMSRVDLRAEAADNYLTQRNDSLMIEGYRRVSRIEPEDIAARPLFSINDFVASEQQYDAATAERQRFIDDTYDRFNAQLTASSASIETMTGEVAAIRARRAETVENTVLGVGGFALKSAFPGLISIPFL